MKKLTYILLDFLFISIILLFTVGVNLQDNPPPGWYQQTLPVNDFINDIFFLDSLNGWIVTDGGAAINDTAYILRTTNGGDNWQIQNAKEERLTSIQFLDLNNGYAAGGGNGTTSISFYKTTNGGANWQSINNIIGTIIDDIYFINKDTGWVCDEDPLFGGLYKTTNGGNSWVQQLNENYRPLRVFFINKDTGWVGTYSSNRLYRTTNGGTNWNIQYTFPGQINDIYFLDKYVGIVTSGRNQRTTDGGFTWIESNDAGIKISMGSDSVGWAGINLLQIQKTTNQGITWGNQTTNTNNPSVSAFDSLVAWAGGNRVVHTTDGGGPMANVQQISNEIPTEFKLYQNYPNPFNSTTFIKFKVKSPKFINLTVFNLEGREISILVNEKLNPGEYEYIFDGSDLPSGVYFYSLVVDGNTVDTKKMIYLK